MKIVLGFGLLCVLLRNVVCLECYECQNVATSECNTTRNCPPEQSCFAQRTSDTTFDLGCKSNQQCGVHAANTGAIVGRSSEGTRRQTPCLECCTSDFCNDNLCSHAKPSACIDDETLDCAKLNTLFGICADIQHAKNVCPKFCGLCQIVDGNWANWSTWSNCDVSCDNGTQARTRTCTNPAPAYGGLNCTGASLEIKPCTMPLCPVNGGWSQWTEWGSCSATCGVGLQRRDRSCSAPYPDRYGQHCYGESRDDRVCVLTPCSNGCWSSWGSWGACSVSCGSGLRSRSRQCNNPTPSPYGHMCEGSSEQYVLCKTLSCIYPDCYSIKQNEPYARSGIYIVDVAALQTTVEVYCDMKTGGGGWTVFQKRVNGQISFDEGFKEYEDGFGNIDIEFWLGLKYIYYMTSNITSELRLDMTTVGGVPGYEEFKNFSLSSAPDYTLHIDAGTGTAGDDARYGLSRHNGKPFYTRDHDNSFSCAASYGGGWWYNNCYTVNFNARRYPDELHYYTFENTAHLSYTKMMFRRMP